MNNIPRVLVIEHQSNAGIGLFGERLLKEGVELDVTGPDTGKEIPESLQGYDGMIVLGGATGPLEDDKAPWLPDVRKRIEEALEQELPLLGICLGAQLLTTVVGGQVKEMPTGPELGLHTVKFDKSAQEDALFSALNHLSETELPVIQWHYLESHLPTGVKNYASSRRCENQAFRVATAAWGVQFHPEALASTAQDWSIEDASNLELLGLDAEKDVLTPIQESESDLRAIWAALAERFARISRESRVLTPNINHS